MKLHALLVLGVLGLTAACVDPTADPVEAAPAVPDRPTMTLAELTDEVPGCEVTRDEFTPFDASRDAVPPTSPLAAVPMAIASCPYSCTPVWARCDQCSAGKLKLVDRWYCATSTPGCPAGWYTRTGPCLSYC
ncbi:MAG: hypothetical protein R3B06_04335 [Kofleriaceae bacterium]